MEAPGSTHESAETMARLQATVTEGSMAPGTIEVANTVSVTALSDNEGKTKRYA